MQVKFAVIGTPMPKGSTKAFMPKGARFPVVTDDNPKTKPWTEAVRVMLIDALQQKDFDYEEMCRLPVRVECLFEFARPKAHYGTGRNAGKVKDSAPKRHTQKPDVDKLARAILDGLTGVAIHDDSQVEEIDCIKYWTTGRPRAVVSLEFIGVEEV